MRGAIRERRVTHELDRLQQCRLDRRIFQRAHQAQAVVGQPRHRVRGVNAREVRCVLGPPAAERHGIAVDYSRWRNVASWIARMKDRPSWVPVNDAFYKYVVQPNAKVQLESL